MPIISLAQEEMDQAHQFAHDVVSNTYNRFNRGLEERIERIYYGKIGEIAFLKYLRQNNIEPRIDGMFEVYEGESNVDEFDFITSFEESVDVKTAYKNYHIRILIPYDQFEDGRAKDFYVGVKTLDGGRTVDVIGYTTRESLERNGLRDFGEGRAYHEFLRNLTPIDNILPNFF